MTEEEMQEMLDTLISTSEQLRRFVALKDGVIAVLNDDTKNADDKVDSILFLVEEDEAEWEDKD
mgnify:CR=1 FL=1